MYKTFIKVYTTGEVARVGGQEVWDDMLNEYSSYLKTENSDKSFDIWKQISFCEWRLKIVDVSLEGLRDMYRECFANALAEAGFDLIKNLDDEKKYQKQLVFVETEAMSIVVRLNQLYVQYNQLKPKDNGEVHEKKEIDFDKELAVLAKQGYRVNKRKQTVLEYCAAVNAFFDEIKRIKQQNKK